MTKFNLSEMKCFTGTNRPMPYYPAEDVKEFIKLVKRINFCLEKTTILEKINELAGEELSNG